jgi:hypothetical protein
LNLGLSQLCENWQRKIFCLRKIREEKFPLFDQMQACTGLLCASDRELVYNRWAVELAKTAHIRYTCPFWGGSRKPLYWKMSIHPLEVSMVQHGLFDGLITYHQLQRTAQKFAQPPEDTVHRTEIGKWPLV